LSKVRNLAWPEDDEVLFCALGGVGEIGMNMYLYGHAGRWLMVDCGVTFGDAGLPGTDVLMADPGFIVANKDRLEAIVLTHGHEDHIGAVQWLWPRLGCPVYATRFTAELVRGRLSEAGLLDRVPLEEVAQGARWRVGPFALRFVTLTHSIPEPNALAIGTRVGTILHTGDWKIDPEPLIGKTTDEEGLAELGEKGVLALIGDSTNAMVEGSSGSEAAVRDSLIELVGTLPGRIAVTCFASNVARIASIVEAAVANDRNPVLVGRSMHRLVEAARAAGYLRDLPDFVDEEDAGFLPRDKTLLICTGSQGEPRAALARIARDEHNHVSLEEGDTVIFSSRVIPGNEVAIDRVRNDLARAGVRLITDATHFVHVSGHPARDELVQMYQWIRPRIAVPVHGEMRHLLAHAELARACQVPQTPVILDGDMLSIRRTGAEIVGKVDTGQLAVDGRTLVPLGASTMKARTQMLWNGSAVVTLVLDRKGKVLSTPVLSAPGLIGDGPEDAALAAEVVEDVMSQLDGLSTAEKRDDTEVTDAARRALRASFRARRGKRPTIDVHLVRV